MEFVETNAPQADRRAERPARVEAAGDLVDAIQGLARVAGHRQEIHEVRHLNRIAAIGEGDRYGVSAAHPRVAAGVDGTVSAVRTPVSRVDEVDGRVIAIEWRWRPARRRHEAVHELRLPVDDLAVAQSLSHAVAVDDGGFDHGIGLVAKDLFEIVPEILQFQRETRGIARRIFGDEERPFGHEERVEAFLRQ